jgi:Uma2 family endonuclease
MSRLKKAFAETIDYPESDGKPVGETDTHRDLIFELIRLLRAFFRRKKDVYVSGNLMMYYEEGKPGSVVSPDVFVVFGIAKGQRRIYRTWEEGRGPDVVIEVSSRKTRREDFDKKMRLYAQLGVKEYFIFDPEYPKRRKPLNAYRLTPSGYVEVLVSSGRVMSEALGLELVDTGETLRLFDPKAKRFLPTEDEESQARQEVERKLRVEMEARQQAEAELARLRQEIERLRKKK